MGKRFVPEAIFFDVDGVLIDSMHVKGEAFADVFGGYPDHRVAIMAFHMEHGGVTRRDKIDRIAREVLGFCLAPEELDDLVTEFGKVVVDRVVAAPEIPGATLALTYWSHWTRLYAVSATPVEELRAILRDRGIADYFQVIEGAPISKSQAINSIATDQGYQRRNCVLVGDSRQDADSASESSVLFVQVCPSGGQLFPGADAVVPDLRTLDVAIHALTGSLLDP